MTGTPATPARGGAVVALPVPAGREGPAPAERDGARGGARRRRPRRLPPYREETALARTRRARAIDRALALSYPDAHCELDFATPLQLLVATILSAQCTDQRVNQVTPTLFARYPDAAALAGASRAELAEIIRPTGFFRNKSASLVGMAQALCERYGGVVPGRLADLVTLPGVGRKTANVVLGNAFGVPGITVDTHVSRLSRRLGLTDQVDPERIEADLGATFPRRDWTGLSHRLIFHGRRVCFARRPACGACPVAALCPSYGIGPVDPVEAARPVKGRPEDAA